MNQVMRKKLSRTIEELLQYCQCISGLMLDEMTRIRFKTMAGSKNINKQKSELLQTFKICNAARAER